MRPVDVCKHCGFSISQITPEFVESLTDGVLKPYSKKFDLLLKRLNKSLICNHEVEKKK